MSRPPDEYFAAPGPAPSLPPTGYFGEADTPIRGMRGDRVFVDEMTMICGRHGKQAALDEMMRLGRKNDSPAGSVIDAQVDEFLATGDLELARELVRVLPDAWVRAILDDLLRRAGEVPE
jgi:hypothetical protein